MQQTHSHFGNLIRLLTDILHLFPRCTVVYLGCSNVSEMAFPGVHNYVKCFVREVRYWWPSDKGRMMVRDVFCTITDDCVLDKFGHLNEKGVSSVFEWLDILHFSLCNNDSDMLQRVYEEFKVVGAKHGFGYLFCDSEPQQ